MAQKNAWRSWMFQRTRAVTFFAIAWMLGVLSTVFALMYFNTGSTLASGLTKRGLMAVRPGITDQEVVSLLGRPLWEHRYYGRGIGTQWVGEADEFVWQYAHPGFLDSGFAIYVTFKQQRVVAAEIKYDDFGVYSCTRWKCPQMIGDDAVLNDLPDRH